MTVSYTHLFTDTAQNVVLIGGPGTGKTHLATALAVSGITRHGKRVRFYSTVDLVNLLEREKHDGLSLIHIFLKSKAAESGTAFGRWLLSESGISGISKAHVREFEAWLGTNHTLRNVCLLYTSACSGPTASRSSLCPSPAMASRCCATTLLSS